MDYDPRQRSRADHSTERTAPLLNLEHQMVEYPYKNAFHSSTKTGNVFNMPPLGLSRGSSARLATRRARRYYHAEAPAGAAARDGGG